MSTAANKRLVQQVYEDSANRSGTTFVDNLAEDASWIVTGQYSWSHEFRGREAILDGLMGHFRSFSRYGREPSLSTSSPTATSSRSRRAATM